MEEYVFFWQNGSPFSQWHKSTFTAHGFTYNCAEQYMMHQKALLFGDTVVAEAIMKEKNPRQQKSWGRKVRGFDAEVWNKQCRDIVYEGNYYKFTQNPHLMDELQKTVGKHLVEASPYDKIWGIGLGPDDPKRFDKSKWRGTNWLGKELTRLRIILIGG